MDWILREGPTARGKLKIMFWCSYCITSSIKNTKDRWTHTSAESLFPLRLHLSGVVWHRIDDPASHWQIGSIRRLNLQCFSPVILIRCDRRGLADFLVAQCANKLREQGQCVNSSAACTTTARAPRPIWLLSPLEVPAHPGQTGRDDGVRTGWRYRGEDVGLWAQKKKYSWLCFNCNCNRIFRTNAWANTGQQSDDLCLWIQKTLLPLQATDTEKLSTPTLPPAGWDGINYNGRFRQILPRFKKKQGFGV